MSISFQRGSIQSFDCKRLSNGRFAIIGTTPEVKFPCKTIIVFSQYGGMAKQHPTLKENTVLYEFSVGDWIAQYDFTESSGLLQSFCIQEIRNNKAICVLADALIMKK